MKNRLLPILRSRYPILLGAMRGITMGQFSAAVSRAGGFGQIASSRITIDRLREEIGLAKGLTDKPFGLNIPLHRPNALDLVDLAIEMKIPVITTSGGNPEKIMERASSAGIRVLHKVSTPQMGKKAQSAGVDAVIAMGFEAGGHGGKEQITTFCLVPRLVDLLDIPVIAAGGISDARGVVAAMALGADGVEIGTAFLATRECPVQEFYKQAVLDADVDGTAMMGHGAMHLRVLKTPAALCHLNKEKADYCAGPSVIYTSKEARYDNSIMPAGQGAGLVTSILPLEKMIDRLMAHSEKLLAELSNGLTGVTS